MPLWGATDGKEKKPTYLTIEEKEKTYATDRGWVYERSTGKTEVLVAAQGLKTKLGAPNISSVRLADREIDGNLVFHVGFNEKVTVTGVPNFSVNGTGLAGNTANVIYTSGSGSSLLVFTGTPGENSNISSGLTMSNNISLGAGASIVDEDSVAANVSFHYADGDTDVVLDLTSVKVNNV